MQHLKMVVTDLDGTLLKNDKTISSKDLQTLEDLGKAGIIRVIATGRNLKKVEQVIPADHPFDYVIFSSGAGIAKWRTKEVLFQKEIPGQNTHTLIQLFQNEGFNFKFSAPIPDNERFYYSFPKPDQETDLYLQTHVPYGQQLMKVEKEIHSCCQFLVFLPFDMDEFQRLRVKVLSVVQDISIICASSPYLTPYLWMEIFDRGVSKGHAIDWLNKYTGTTHLQTIGIGNDYNDIEMLEHAYHAFITENAPEELKKRYNVCRSNEESGFSSAIEAIQSE